MKNIFVKTTVIVFALIFALSVFAGCGKNTNESETQAEEESEVLGEETVVSNENGEEIKGHKVSKLPADISDEFTYLSVDKSVELKFSLSRDGKFEGTCQKTDVSETGDDYKNGTVYINGFTGEFSNFVKISDTVYSLRLKTVQYTNVKNTEEILDGTRYVYSEAFGLDGGYEFTLYTPECSMDDIPEGAKTFIKDGAETGVYILENKSGEEFFAGV